MSQPTDVINSCVEDLRTKIQDLLSAESAYYIYSQKELTDLEKQIGTPFVAIVYEGTSRSGNDKGGLMTNNFFGVMVVAGQESFVLRDVDEKVDGTGLLETVQRAIQKTNSPTDHSWRFERQQLADFGVAVGYYQQWSTLAVLQ